jgi:glycosyltransferase involved in cell wall biosynthesis
VPADDPEALAEALVKLGEDAALRARMGSQGRAHYERSFTMEAAAEASLAVYREAAARWNERTRG